MAKIHIERAYIEPFEEEDPQSFQILIHVKQGNDKGQIDHIFAGKVELAHNIQWLHTYTAENGDLVINNSAGMEEHKWDHLTREIIDG
jgi:hypothetical protein